MRKPMSVSTDFDQRREGVQEVVVPIRGQPYTARKAIRSGRLRHVAVGDRCIRILYSPGG